MARLGDLCTIQSGGTPSRHNKAYWENGTIPWVKISDIKDKYINTTGESITKSGLESSSAKIFSSGTILYTIFATLGEVCILNIDAATNQAIAGIQLKSGSVERNYLYYYLLSLKTIVNEIGRGVAQSNINLTILRELEVPLPPLDEQRKIAAVLDKVSDLIAKRRQQLDKLDMLVKARFVEMFGAFPKDIKLSEVATITGGLTKNSNRKNLPLKLPYLRVANVAFNSVDVSEILEIGLTEEERKKTLLQKGDLLFVEGNGSPDQIGRVAVWNNQITPCVHQNHLIKARFDNSIVLPAFALHYYMNSEGRQQIREKAVSTSGLYTLSVSKIESLVLPTPPMELQEQFSTFVEQTDKSKLSIQKSCEKLETLKKALMQQYFG